jgi:hypothetical protein
MIPEGCCSQILRQSAHEFGKVVGPTHGPNLPPQELLLALISVRHYGPGVESASNRNEYQEYFLGVKAAGV